MSWVCRRWFLQKTEIPNAPVATFVPLSARIAVWKFAKMKTKTKNRIAITGNEAIGEAAVIAGCQLYAGYPITPQNELTAYMAKRLNETGGIFIQAESELAAINMVFGAS